LRFDPDFVADCNSTSTKDSRSCPRAPVRLECRTKTGVQRFHALTRGTFLRNFDEHLGPNPQPRARVLRNIEVLDQEVGAALKPWNFRTALGNRSRPI
jgi:hypothetical protein